MKAVIISDVIITPVDNRTTTNIYNKMLWWFSLSFCLFGCKI